MCATYTYVFNQASLNNDFPDLEVDPMAPFEKVAAEVFPHTYGHVIVLKDGRPVITAKRYSLTPSWAKEEKVKWATYNARMNRENVKTGKLEYIYEVPTWKGAFGKRHCLIPLNNFRESCHEGKADGHIVNFTPDSTDTLYAAGIYEDWVNIKTGEIISTYAIVTTEPDEFIKGIGHDRSPVFLSADSARGWIEPFKSVKAAYQYLEDHGFNPTLNFELVRKLKTYKSQSELELK